jgi:di/tricarboxylate transporter
MPASSRNQNPTQPDDGTSKLLQWGSSILGSGLLAALLLLTVLGGFSPTGASTNTGWFTLIVALACIPFGSLLLALGVAKWFRNRRIAQDR